MNIAAKRIHRKYEKKRLRLPVWALVMMIFMLTVLTSAIKQGIVDKDEGKLRQKQLFEVVDIEE